MSIFGKHSGFSPFTKAFLLPNDTCIRKIKFKIAQLQVILTVLLTWTIQIWFSSSRVNSVRRNRISLRKLSIILCWYKTTIHASLFYSTAVAVLVFTSSIKLTVTRFISAMCVQLTSLIRRWVSLNINFYQTKYGIH